MASLSAKNDEKFEQLYHLHNRSMLGFAMKHLRSIHLAEDIVQEAFLRVFKHIEKLEAPDAPRTKRYLLMIVRNLCFDYLGRNVPDEDLADYAAFLGNPLEDIWSIFTLNEINRKLKSFIDTLPEDSRELFIDTVIDGKPYKELTEKYNLTEKHISVKVFRLRLKLRKYMEEE